MSLYSLGEDDIIGKHGGAKEEARASLRRYKLVFEGVLGQCGTAEDPAGYLSALQSV